MRAFTEIRDVDLKILSELDDRSLLNSCATNKYVYNICKDENIWRNRFIKKYGEHVASYRPTDRSWKNHYMQIIIDLEKFAYNPLRFFDYIFVGQNDFYTPKKSLYAAEWIPLDKSPEWVINNFWLLNLGKSVNIKGLSLDFTIRDETGLTPAKVKAEIIKLYTLHERDAIGFMSRGNYLSLRFGDAKPFS